MKFEKLLQDLKKIHVLDKVLACKYIFQNRSFPYINIFDMYTVEFQKRGLPHAHLLIFLHLCNKYPTPDDIDRIIHAEIPNQSDDPELHNLVKTHMIHGPHGSCNMSFPCMKNGKCSWYFRKQFQQTVVVYQYGYLIMRTLLSNSISIDNHYVVPYNQQLLKKYQIHVNMEWRNQSTSINYLFKYINKEYDRITIVIETIENGGSQNQANIDEISNSWETTCNRKIVLPSSRRTTSYHSTCLHPGLKLINNIQKVKIYAMLKMCPKLFMSNGTSVENQENEGCMFYHELIEDREYNETLREARD
ncbi:hypothetical protein Lal_00042670 [Lupinus albus]|nr:hypothetical protein Lal_00042670 [Lupinus albus]